MTPTMIIGFNNHYDAMMCWKNPGFAAGRFDPGDEVRIRFYADYTKYGAVEEK